MATIMQTGYYYCVSCEVFISSQDLCRVHGLVCRNPNIQCITLFLPSRAQQWTGTEDVEQEMNAGQMMNAGQLMNTDQMMSVGQMVNAGQVMNAGQAVNEDTRDARIARRVRNSEKKAGRARIYGNENVVINNYYI